MHNESAQSASFADAASSTQPVITKLTGSRMPLDRGTSSLGLLMQLGGTLGVTLAAFLARASSDLCAAHRAAW